MQTLPYLVAEMRQLGIRRLDLELEADAPATLPAPPPDEEPTELKDPGVCAFGDCQSPREGILGGVATQFCRAHAFQMAGVKT